MKTFSMSHLVWERKEPEVFTEATAPKWLTSEGTIKGTTMDDRWFWNDYVLTLEVGQSVETDFSRITRIA